MTKITKEDVDVVNEKLNTLVNSILSELSFAVINSNKFSSIYEGFSVIREEFLELKKEVYAKKHLRDYSKIKTESLHLCAMSLRLILDCVPPEEENNG